MDEKKDILGMLDLMIPPALGVKDNKIIKLNFAAQGLLLTPGMDIRQLFHTGQREYADFESGCLYLTLCIGGEFRGASVLRMGATDIFVLEEDSDHSEFRSMALAARELREPLTNVMVAANQLISQATQNQDPQLQNQAARLNRGLYQMLRILGNMSDAGQHKGSRQETCDVCACLKEILDKAAQMMQHTGITLTYSLPHGAIFTLANRELLERAILNILSNSVKFSPKGGTVQVSVSRNGNLLRLSIQDSGEGIPEDIFPSLFQRYLRQPGIEDSRYGIGLGMVLIRNAAAAHGGTVLIDQPKEAGTRITMTLQLHTDPGLQLKSPVLSIDYAGERDHCLLELSESLPAFLYATE